MSRQIIARNLPTRMHAQEFSRLFKSDILRVFIERDLITREPDSAYILFQQKSDAERVLGVHHYLGRRKLLLEPDMEFDERKELIVSNIPRHFHSYALEKLFSQTGIVHHARVLKKPFVGQISMAYVKHAQNAISLLNKTHIHGHVIEVKQGIISTWSNG